VLLHVFMSAFNPRAPAGFASLGGTLFFSATDAIAGNELWRTGWS
jgi:hypothetical protein